MPVQCVTACVHDYVGLQLTCDVALTPQVHAALLERLSALRREEGSGRLVLDDPYWQQLQALPAAEATQQAGP